MYNEKDEPIICKHEGCNNVVSKSRIGSNGYTINFLQCHICSLTLSKYKLNSKQRDDLLISQNCKCAICNKTISFLGQTKKGMDTKAAASIDHNHETGKTRGILCNPCNRALGLFQDSKINLSNAISYLSKHE